LRRFDAYSIMTKKTASASWPFAKSHPVKARPTKYPMKKILKSIPRHLVYILTIYLWGLLFFGAYRMLFLLAGRQQLNGAPAWTIIKAFGMGLRFDTVVSGFLLAIPLVLMSVAAGFKWESEIFLKVLSLFLWLAYSLAFFGCGADIPYFLHYYSRLTVAALQWTDTPGFMVKMIFQDRSYYPYITFFLASCLLWGLALRRAYRKILASGYFESPQGRLAHLSQTIGLSLVAALLLAVGIRGRTAHKSPIRIGTAFFSTHAFPNQMGLNPVYTFFYSALEANKNKDRELRLMDPEEAVARARIYLKAKNSDRYDSPLARPVQPKGKEIPANVVLIIMEGMSAERMVRYGSKDSLTPFLDSLALNSLCFDNVYTAGFHTFNGVYGALFGMPALMKQHPMHGAVSLQPFSGLGQTLLSRNYTTGFFCTHDAQFDNMSGFLGNNGFQHITSQADYPSNRVLSTLGVADDFMFEYSLPLLNRWNKGSKPFLAVYLTSSNHGPEVIPRGIPFVPRSRELSKQIIEYSDWALEKFVDLCRREPWFDSTIFVFVADHGVSLDPVYDLPLSLNHTPLLIYGPGVIKTPKFYQSLGGQIDIGPTVLGLLNVPYVNNTLGVDLINEPRPYAYFCADDKIGVVDQENYLVIRENGPSSLYKYRQRDPADHSAGQGPLCDSMRVYAYAMMQAAQWLIANKKTGPQK
jgi:phosphoglycerol transferase MdoB-like AlkP superfamily enzyme